MTMHDAFRRTRLFFRTVPRGLHWLAAAAVLLVFAHGLAVTRLDNYLLAAPPLSAAASGVLASVLASYVFYLVVIHLKEFRDRAIVYPHILRWARQVVADCEGQLQSFAKAAGQPLSLDVLTKERLQGAFLQIRPMAEAPLILWPRTRANWMQYMDHYRLRSSSRISQILTQLIYLEAEFVRLLTKIDDCGHFSMLKDVGRIPMRNEHLGNFASQFYDYCVACRALSGFLEAYEVDRLPNREP